MYIENNNIKNQLSTWLVFIFFLIAAMIVVGGLTRLTDSGLSITKWELFSGIFPPLNEQEWIYYFDEYKQIPEYKLQNFSMTMSEFKIIFWWEWAHRLLGRLVGLCFLIPLIYFTFKIQFKKLLNLYFIFLLICFQGFIGWYMVSSGLVQRVDVSHFRLSIHLFIAFVILSMIFWNYLKINVKIINYKRISSSITLTFLLLIYFQLIIGAFVSGMDAGKIYNSWPLMGESYFPNDSNLVNLFSLKAFDEPSLVQFIHRNLAYLIFFLYIFIAYKIYVNKLTPFYKTINLLGCLLLLQIILGILTVIFGAQIYFSSMHQISSIFLVSSNIYLIYLNSNTSLQPSN